MRHLGRLAVSLAVLAATLAWTSSALAAGDIVISQVYGGGGNSGATYKNDFIELYNRGATDVDISTWSVQYASATGTSWAKTNLGGTIRAGHYYLVQEAAGAGGTVDLPTPDATGNIAMSATGAKVALVMSQTTITAGVACPSVVILSDFVGYSPGATCAEGTPTPSLSNTTAALRKQDGAQDTDNNSADFDVAAPNPRNGAEHAPFVTSTSPGSGAAGVAQNASITVSFSEPVVAADPWYTISCATSGSHTATSTGGPRTFTIDPDVNFAFDESCTVTIDHAQVTDVDTDDPPDTMDADYVWSFHTVAPPVEIAEIQGSSHISPKANQSVNGVDGIVTALRTNGFYMQDPTPDANPATSDGIFVFTSSAPTVHVGDRLAVNGRVTEFRPGGASTANLTTTEIGSPSITVVSTGNPLPAATTIGGPGGLVPPNMIIEDDAGGDVETGGIFDPAFDGIDFWESLEAMRLVFPNAVAVGPTVASFGETAIVNDDGNATVRTPRGGLLLQADDFNPERIIADDVIADLPSMNVGDHYDGPLEGVLDYNFGNFFLEVTQSVGRVDSGLQREVTATQSGRQVSVATFNVENLAPGDPPAKYAGLSSLIVNNLKAPDIITIEEVQDSSGAADDGVTDATDTLNKLVAAIQSAGGPLYQYRSIDPVNDQDGGAPGGNIRIAFLFRSDHGVEFVDRPGAGSLTPNTVVPGPDGPHLEYSPGRIDPTNDAWKTSRKPLAAEFKLHGRTFFLIGNHFNSKGGDQPLMGRFQPPTRSSETQRHLQAQVENDFIDSIREEDAEANIVVLGDLNDFQFSDTVTILTGGGSVLHDLIDTLPPAERYSYEFEGNAQVLDHILASPSVTGHAPAPVFDVLHVNSEFFDQASDHDPSVVRLTLNRKPTVHANGPYSVVEGSTITLAATGSDPDGDSLTYRWDLNGDGVYETAGQSVSFTGPDGPPSVLVSVRASDGDEIATDSATVTVVVTVDSLCAFTQRVTRKAGVAAALCDKLRQGAYAEYAELVDAQTGKSISAANAVLLKQLVSRL